MNYPIIQAMFCVFGVSMLAGLAPLIAGCVGGASAGGSPDIANVGKVRTVPAVSSSSVTVPVAPEEVLADPVVDLSAGLDSTCAVRSSGKVVCWGEAPAGHKGVVAIPGVLDAIGVSTCLDAVALTKSGQVFQWWFTNANVDKVTPFPSKRAIRGAKSVSRGADFCWIDDAQNAYCEYTLPPNPIAKVRQVSLGLRQGCFLHTNGTVSCWNTLAPKDGGPPKANVSPPVLIPGLSSVRKVSVGGSHACALLENGTVKCWGSNDMGELGVDPETLPEQPNAGTVASVGGDSEAPPNCRPHTAVPQTVVGLTRAIDISSGLHYSCAALENYEVVCWGSNYHGILGSGARTDTHRPVRIENLGEATRVASGDCHACALLRTGKVACWGDNQEGQLGDGTKVNRITPTLVTLP